MKHSGPWSILGIASIGIWNNLFWIPGPNLVILAWMDDKLSHRQTWLKFNFKVKLPHEGHDQLLPKIIGALTKVFCTFDPNLVILTWTGHESSWGQPPDWHMGGPTNINTHRCWHWQYKGQNCPWVKFTVSRMTQHSLRNISYMT